MLGTAKLLHYLARLSKIGALTGSVPKVVKVVKAIKKPKMSRREFFKVTKEVSEEVKAQNKLMSVGAEMQRNMDKGNTFMRVNRPLRVYEKKANRKAESLVKRLTERNKRKEHLSLINNPKKLRDLHKGEAEFSLYEGLQEEGKSLTKEILRAFNKDYNLEYGGASLEQLAREYLKYGTGLNLSPSLERARAILNAYRKRYGITPEMIAKLENAKELIRSGYNPYTKEGKALLRKYFRRRKKLADISGQPEHKLGSFSLKKPRPDSTSRPEGFDVKDVVSEAKELVKTGGELAESKFKSITKGLKDAWDEGASDKLM